MTLPTFSFGLQSTPLDGSIVNRGIIGEAFRAELTEDGSGLIRLPGWMRIQCESPSRTAQQTLNSIMSGYAAHAPRAYSQDGTTFGLLAEPAMTNRNDNHDFTSWATSGTPLINAVVGPDGVTASLEIEDDDAGAIEFISYAITPGAVAAQHTLSAWHFMTAPTPTNSSLLEYADGVEDPQISLTVVDTDWTHAQFAVSDIGSGTFTIAPRTVTAADVGATRWFGVQLERRSYASRFRQTSHVAVKVEAVSSIVMPDGLIKFTLVYRPHYTHDQAELVDHNLFFIDAANRVFFRASDNNFVFRVNGDDVVSGAVTFAAHDTLTFFFENSTTRRRLIVSGALTGNGTTDGTIQPPLDLNTLPTYTAILGGALGSEEVSDLITLDPSITTFEQLADQRALIQMDDTVGNRKFRDLLRVWAKQPGRFFDICNGLKAALELETAVGFQLDLIGAIVGLAREGFTDTRYRVFLGIQIELLLANARDDAEWTGTSPNLIRIARTFIGPAAGTINFLNVPPYQYRIDVPGLVLSEGSLLARFMTTATWAGVLGIITIELNSDVWDSDAVAITDPAKWDSASVAIVDPGEYNTVLTTT